MSVAPSVIDAVRSRSFHVAPSVAPPVPKAASTFPPRKWNSLIVRFLHDTLLRLPAPTAEDFKTARGPGAASLFAAMILVELTKAPKQILPARRRKGDSE